MSRPLFPETARLSGRFSFFPRHWWRTRESGWTAAAGTFEREIRDQLGRTLAPGGFDPARDITDSAIVQAHRAVGEVLAMGV